MGETCINGVGLKVGGGKGASFIALSRDGTVGGDAACVRLQIVFPGRNIRRSAPRKLCAAADEPNAEGSKESKI